jgi:hypothetical protein
MPTTFRKERQGLPAASVFAAQQPIRRGLPGCLQDGCSALGLHMRTAGLRHSDRSASQAAPWRAPSAQASANVNERSGDRVHKLGFSCPKAGPLNVLGSDGCLGPTDGSPKQTQHAVRLWLPQVPPQDLDRSNDTQ